jgi:hypothetical protein
MKGIFNKKKVRRLIDVLGVDISEIVVDISL